VEPPHADPIPPTGPDDPTAPACRLAPGTEPAFDFDAAMPVFDKFDFSFGRVILNDIVLRTIEATPAPAAAAATPIRTTPWVPEAEAMFRGYVNVLRAFGVDTFAAYDMKGDLAMKQMGQTRRRISFGAKSTGTRGWRGGDSDASYIRDLSYQFNMTEGPMAPAMNMAYSIGYLGMEDLRFDKLYGYMAKGVTPPRTDTDLLSYGKYDFREPEADDRRQGHHDCRRSVARRARLPLVHTDQDHDLRQGCRVRRRRDDGNGGVRRGDFRDA
jgi:hypothetical protein